MDYSYFQDKKVLVTGGAGAIGSRLTRKLLKHGSIVIVLDDLSSGYLWNLPKSSRLMFVEGDVSDDIILKRVFGEEPEVIFHLAAFFANQNSVDYPEKDLLTNGFGTLKLLEYCSLVKNVERFVYASSGCSIYPTDAPMPYVEELTTMYMSTPYQITKMLGELYCNYYQKMKEVPVAKARFFNSYGAGEVPGQYRNVIPNFIYWAMNGIALPITGTGEETRDFTYVGDIVDGLLRMAYLKEALGEEINLAAGREVKIKDLAQKIIDRTESHAGIEFLPRRKWDTKPRLLASNEKAKKILGFTPTIDFDVGLDEAIEWFKTHWEEIEKSADFPPGTSSAVRHFK